MTTVTTKSKRKARKRKFAEMQRESKRISKSQLNPSKTKAMNSDDSPTAFHKATPPSKTITSNPSTISIECKSPDRSSPISDCTSSHSSQLSDQASQLSIPSPVKQSSPTNLDDIECDGVLLKSQKANLDELSYLIRGIECSNTAKNSPKSDSKSETTHKIKQLAQLGLWLHKEKHQLLLHSSPKCISIILHHLRQLCRHNSTKNPVILSCILLIVLILSQDNLNNLNDVAVNILLRLVPYPHPIRSTLSRFKATLSLSQSQCNNDGKQTRRSRRNRNKQGAAQRGDSLDLNALVNAAEPNDGVITLSESCSIGYVASFLLVKVVANAMREKANVGEDARDREVCLRRVVEYMRHPEVVCKLACMVQSDCYMLEKDGMIRDKCFTQFMLLDVVTRNLDHGSGSSQVCVKEGLLKILDCVGIALRFVTGKYKVMALGMVEVEDVEMVDRVGCGGGGVMKEEMQRLLVLALKVLTNVTHGRNVSLKPDTVESIMYLLTRYDHIVDSIDGLMESVGKDVDESGVITLLLGCLINVSERNKLFRNAFYSYSVGGGSVIGLLLHMFQRCRSLIVQIEAEKKEQNELDVDETDDEKDGVLFTAYTEYKQTSYYLSLLLGFLLQSNENFKCIAAKMNDLSALVLCLQQLREFQAHMKGQSNNSTHTLTVIAKVTQIVQIRNQTLKSLQSAVS